jgi:hypothetical protein
MIQAHLFKEWLISFCNTFHTEKPSYKGVWPVQECVRGCLHLKDEFVQRHWKLSRVNKNVYQEIMVIFLRDQDRLLLSVNIFLRLSHLRWEYLFD